MKQRAAIAAMATSPRWRSRMPRARNSAAAATKKPPAGRTAVKKTLVKKVKSPKTTVKERVSKKRPTTNEAGKATPEVTT